MTTSTEFTERFLLDPAVNAEPYPYLNALREYQPVAWSALHRAWLVSGHAQVVRCLREPAISANRGRPSPSAVPESVREDWARASEIMANWMVFNDPPVHRRLRGVFSEAFSARAVGRYHALIERTTRALLARRAVHGQTGDLVADVAKPLPALVFARWLGVPPQHGPSFWYWNARVGDLVLGAAQEEREYRTSAQSLVNLYNYLAGLVRQRRAEPGDDLISIVLGSGGIGSEVSEDEFVGMLTQLAFAGGETTSNLIANGLRALLLRPPELAAVREQPELVVAAVEEALRFDGPSKMSIRAAADDFDLDGHAIRAGDRVFLVTAAANRDPSQFDHPDVFSVTRDRTAAHLGFGYGPHFCIGASLARLVARCAMDALVQDHPGLELVGDRHEWQLSLLNRSLIALPVHY
jgi:cytochrome P450